MMSVVCKLGSSSVTYRMVAMETGFGFPKSGIYTEGLGGSRHVRLLSVRGMSVCCPSVLSPSCVDVNSLCSSS